MFNEKEVQEQLKRCEELKQDEVRHEMVKFKFKA
jgi:hypothetical protein